jgi:hypothetical protein
MMHDVKQALDQCQFGPVDSGIPDNAAMRNGLVPKLEKGREHDHLRTADFSRTGEDAEKAYRLCADGRWAGPCGFEEVLAERTAR